MVLTLWSGGMVNAGPEGAPRLPKLETTGGRGRLAILFKLESRPSCRFKSCLHNQ